MANQEKMEEMRQDMLYEQQLRRDWDTCLEHSLSALDLTMQDITQVQKLIDYINSYGWAVEFKDLKDMV